MGIKHSYAATGVNDGAKQVSVDRWNENHTIDSELVLPAITPVAPPGDNIAIYGQNIAGRMMLTQMGPSGLDTSFQPNLGGNKVALWMPPGGSTTVPGVFGMSALTALGTATSRTITTVNMLTRMTRLGYVSATPAGSLTGAREAVAKFTLGAGGGLGGFFYRVRFGVTDATTVTAARMFIGLWSSTGAPANVEVNTLTNIVGVCKLSTSTNLHFYCAGASVDTAIDLGITFPATSLTADAYELTLFSPPAGGSVSYRVHRLNTGDIATGTISAGLPTSNTLLCIQNWRTNNTTASAVALDICGIYVETDY